MGASCGQDFDFHLQSWLAVDAAWHAGHSVPHWVAPANHGAGEARFVFYPPLSWLLGGVLGLVLPWAYVPAALAAVCVAGAAAAMYRLARTWCEPLAAVVGAALYCFSPYLLFTGYERTAYGELLAAVWFPWLFRALLRSELSMAGVALPFAALWYTNAPSAVMASYLAALAILWRASLRRHAGMVAIAMEAARGSLALALGGLLAADYILPAWYEQRWVSIRRAVGPGMRVEDSFLFTHTGEPYHDQVLHTASWIAVLTLGTGIFLVIASRLLQSRAPASVIEVAARQVRAFLLLALVVILALQWRASDPFWHLLPQLEFLQFPWRWLLPASALAALAIALALPAGGRVSRRGALAATAVFVAALVTWAAHTRYQPCDEEDRVSAQLPLAASGGPGFEGTDEYTARDADNGEIQQGLPRVRLLAAPDANEGDDSAAANPAWKPDPSATIPGTIRVSQWTAEAIRVVVQPDRAAYAVLRLERFAAWQVLLNGAPCASRCVEREDGLVTVALAPLKESLITARYTATGDVTLGRGLSLSGLFLLGVAALPLRRGRRRPQL